MLSLLPVLLVLAASPAPAATDAPAPAQLQKIGSTHGSLCLSIVQHANLAIGSTLDNDQSLALLNLNLRGTDFERLNSMQRRNAIDALDKQAGAIRFAVAEAEKAVKDMRAEAEASNDPERKAELKAFADAIGGALNRQRKEAMDFQGAVSIEQGRREVAEVAQFRADADRMNDPGIGHIAGANLEPNILATPPKDINAWWKSVADDLAERHAAIKSDEGIAQFHSAGAVKGC